MEYYERRIRAMKRIKKLLKTEASKKAIACDIGLNYGFPSKAVKQMVEQLTGGEDEETLKDEPETDA